MKLAKELLGNEIELKPACCNFYEHEIVKLLLGDSMHPGGLELTKKLGERLYLTKNDKVLDVASGLGTSAIFLAEQFECNIVGIDISAKNVAEATKVATEKNLTNVEFQVGDVANMRYANEFDVVISECSFCLFENKSVAAKSINRALKSNGRLGITDVAIEKKLPSKAQNLLFRVACIGDALSMQGYQTVFQNAGFSIETIIDEREMVNQTLKSIKGKLFLFELAKGLKKIDIENINISEIKKWLKTGETYVNEGYGTYMTMIGKKKE